MSRYFRNLPNFEYISRINERKTNKDFITVKNLFRRPIIREDLLPDRVDSDDPNIKEAEDVEVKPQSRLITPQQEIGDVNVTSPNINITPPMTQEQPVQAASLPTSPSEGITSLNKGEQFEGLFPTDNLGRMIANRRS